MKHSIAVISIFALLFILACTKETGTVGTQDTAPLIAAPAGNGGMPSTSGKARLSGPGYSQSISVELANSMIQSYLTSVKYPAMDTALRALTFDADTLRAYLQNPNIVSVKFMMAHQPAYKNSGNNGKYSGMNPNALTMVVVGLNSNDQYVLNNRNEVYEHFSPCPNYCPSNTPVMIQ